VRGALDEKQDIYSKAVALEEGEEEDAPDLEQNVAPRPALRMHSIKISLAIMLVILTQALGVARVSPFHSCVELTYLTDRMDSC
jgi:hypothetical protein